MAGILIYVSIKTNTSMIDYLTHGHKLCFYFALFMKDTMHGLKNFQQRLRNLFLLRYRETNEIW